MFKYQPPLFQVILKLQEEQQEAKALTHVSGELSFSGVQQREWVKYETVALWDVTHVLV